MKEQKRHFEELLRTTVGKDGRIGFIGEEWGLCAQTIAQQLNITWANINTSRGDLNKLGIPCDYLHGNYTDVQKAGWNRRREEFMVEQVRCRRAMGKNGLIICGFDHLDQLSVRLKLDGVALSKIDYRTMTWYTPTFTDDN